jgi:HD-GYP domain-containing protein (c-di-GMP phosphodiesterase class II)
MSDIMIKDPQLTLFDLAICLSDACDLVSPSLGNHHKQVAYMASRIGTELGLDDDSQKDLVLAGTMHDIGALSLNEQLDDLRFEIAHINVHAEVGYSLLRLFKPMERLAKIVRHHHHPWNEENRGDGVMIESDIIHIADRVAALIKHGRGVLGQAGAIRTAIAGGRGTLFRPEVHDAFVAASHKEYFWLDAVSPTIYRILRRQTRMKTLSLDLAQLRELAALFARIIDFRSRFTATHSAGVAAAAEALAKSAGFSRRECEHMKIAGLLHDLGKLAVPREVLEKAGKLDSSEFDLIRAHTYHTYRILDTLDDFDTINMWAAFHHERLTGGGYPFHHAADDLSLGSRIMGVADVFTATAEDRPYRAGMKPEEVRDILYSMVKSGSLDGAVVDLLERNVEAVSAARLLAQDESGRIYKELMGIKEE